MKAALACVLGVVMGTPHVAAQSQKTATSKESVVGTVRQLWDIPTQYITTLAEETAESTYAFRPTPEVRTLGQLIAHVANAQYMFCATALGEQSPSKEDIEKARETKAALVEALKASTEYCGKAYKQSDQAVQQSVNLFGEQRSRLFTLGLNASHNWEHYGNLATYLRMNGIVPPSSRRGT